MRILMSFIFMLVLLSCNNSDNNNTEENSDAENETSRFDEGSGLKTGIYKLTDSISGNKFILDKEPSKIYWVSDSPLIEFSEFTGVREFNFRYLGKEIPSVKISMDDAARERWKNYTGSNIGKRVAIVINGILVQVPKIRSRVEGGIFAINRDDYTKKDAKSIYNYLKREIIVNE